MSPFFIYEVHDHVYLCRIALRSPPEVALVSECKSDTTGGGRWTDKEFFLFDKFRGKCVDLFAGPGPDDDLYRIVREEFFGHLRGVARAGVHVYEFDLPPIDASLLVDGIFCPFERFFDVDTPGDRKEDTDPYGSTCMQDRISGPSSGCDNEYDKSNKRERQPEFSLFDGYHRVSGSKEPDFRHTCFVAPGFCGPRLSVSLFTEDDNSDWILQILF